MSGFLFSSQDEISNLQPVSNNAEQLQTEEYAHIHSCAPVLYRRALLAIVFTIMFNNIYRKYAITLSANSVITLHIFSIALAIPLLTCCS